MDKKWILTFLLVWMGGFPIVNAQTKVDLKVDLSRGELLYSTHCITCHTTQMHWRDKKIVTNWVNLKTEVRRWQKTSGLEWHEEDVTAVANYLNAQFYHFPAISVAGSTMQGSEKLKTLQAKD